MEEWKQWVMCVHPPVLQLEDVRSDAQKAADAALAEGIRRSHQSLQINPNVDWDDIVEATTLAHALCDMEGIRIKSITSLEQKVASEERAVRSAKYSLEKAQLDLREAKRALETARRSLGQ